jgi:hypothetical protein
LQLDQVVSIEQVFVCPLWEVRVMRASELMAARVELLARAVSRLSRRARALVLNRWFRRAAQERRALEVVARGPFRVLE